MDYIFNCTELFNGHIVLASYTLMLLMAWLWFMQAGSGTVSIGTFVGAGTSAVAHPGACRQDQRNIRRAHAWRILPQRKAPWPPPLDLWCFTSSIALLNVDLLKAIDRS